MWIKITPHIAFLCYNIYGYSIVLISAMGGKKEAGPTHPSRSRHKDIPTPSGTQVEIGNSQYTLSKETQKYLRRGSSSNYEHTGSVIIINEPHESSEGQFNLFKGLESFFASNPELVRQTIFLSEGTTANKPISVQALIDEEPSPSDDIIRQVLQSHLITGYMAYEWKHQQGVPIIGTEDEGLYQLSLRFASLCRENPKAVFQHRKYTDGTEYDIPLGYAWSFIIAARNKRIAQTLIEQVRTYHNPMLFVAWDHVKDRRNGLEKKWGKNINRNLVDAQYMGPIGALMFPWSMAGENWGLYRNVTENMETFDIHHYLEGAKIGYTFLEPKGIENQTPEDTRNYLNVLIAQRK